MLTAREQFKREFISVAIDRGLSVEEMGQLVKTAADQMEKAADVSDVIKQIISWGLASPVAVGAGLGGGAAWAKHYMFPPNREEAIQEAKKHELMSEYDWGVRQLQRQQRLNQLPAFLNLFLCFYWKKR